MFSFLRVAVRGHQAARNLPVTWRRTASTCRVFMPGLWATKAMSATLKIKRLSLREEAA